MPRKALRVDVTVTVYAVSCPGVWLRSNNEAYLSINLFGHYRRTRLAEPVFPLTFQETFRFEKIFYTAIDPSEVSALLEIEPILFELIQLSDTEPRGVRLLASLEDNARDFLYPYPQLSPIYGSPDRTVLMERAPGFPGIAPKLEFSTNAVVVETRVPGARRRRRVKADSVELLDDDDGYDNGRTSRSRRRTAARTFVYPDEEDADKGFQQHTASSLFRSRSPSPAELRASDLSPDESAATSEKPSFLVRKVDDSLIGRKPGSPPKRIPSGAKGERRRRTASPSVSSPSGRPPRLCETVGSAAGERRRAIKGERSGASSPYTSGPSSAEDDDGDDDSEVEYLGFTRDLAASRHCRTVSLPQYLPRRPVSPVVLRRSLRERYSDYLSSAIHRRAEAALRRSTSPARALSPVSPLPVSRPSSSLLRRSHSLSSWYSLDDLERDMRVARAVL